MKMRLSDGKYPLILCFYDEKFWRVRKVKYFKSANLHNLFLSN